MVKVTCPLLAPLAIGIWVGMMPVKSAAVAVPVKARLTVWLPTTGALVVAVTVIAVVPASVPVVGLTERLTVGKSLSVIVTLPVVVVPNVKPAEGLEIVKVPVSVPSIKASSLILTVNEPVVLPLAMVMLVGIVPVKSAGSAVPVNAKLTV